MLWFVYVTEYPDEGSTVVEAHDEESAVVAVAGSGIEADFYSVRPVTVADVEKLQDVAARAGLPKRRVGEAWGPAVIAWADEKLREVWAALASAEFLFGDLEFERSRGVNLARKVAELEAKRLWVMDGLRSSAVRAGEPTDAEMEAAGATDKRPLTAADVNDAAAVAVATTHEFRAIAKALGLGPSATAGEIADAVGQLVASEAAARWIPLAEQLPPQDDETDVEVADFRLTECPKGAIALLSRDGHWVPEGAALAFKPTHWRHLGPSYEAIRAQADEDGVWRHRLAP